ncbi:MAG: DNA repair exonuclease [Clostridia bacterium]|nr:DNA repair exonuclease [Clostridia bacterium]
MIRILHLADLHLGWEPRFLGPQAVAWQQERDNILAAVVEFALEPGNGIDLVLIVGDLFDCHNPGQALVKETMRQLRRLSDSGIKVVTVPGNHDEITYPDSVYRLQAGAWPGILVQNPYPAHVATLELGRDKFHLYSLAYTGGLTKTSPPLNDFPHNGEAGWHVAAFHGSLDWDAGDRSLPISRSALAEAGYDYVALGHLHKPSSYQLGKGVAVYPGSLAAKGWNDPGCGQLTVVSFSSQGVRVEKQELPYSICRPCRLLEVDAGQYQTPAELVAGLKARLNKEEIVSIRLYGLANFAVELEEICTSLEGECYYLEVTDMTESYSPALLDALARENTLRGYYVKRMQELLAGASDEQERRLLTRSLLYGLKALGVSSGE